jgi:hypothetical protein
MRNGTSMALRSIRLAYSITQVLDMEPQIEATIDLLCEKLDERFVYLLYGTSRVIYIIEGC